MCDRKLFARLFKYNLYLHLSDVARACSELKEHLWVVCMSVHLVVVDMGSQAVGGVISPSETYNRILRGVISESSLVVTVMELRRQKVKLKGLVCLLQLLERSEEHTSELQSRQYLVCRLLLEKKKT